ncbi:PREDICTED: uncharacterized protein LOC109584796 isoform X2 [Amphimedon queenslandica]|uniref:Fibrinogen C-terminal domain-containing protein n=1 Tax=Amphimedon queenslandica TaxID=400682 RepID=A0AAN0JHF4_AMPQE|nr:PREDICTED: uncharacterized protein LOC109584796 isoform X2 [Amphimedon queenslandica]|eukprot:XP_019856226.1 PREDICTED: uncharacterized protein LOC109584796 isoform X2 [Amphimedon queenslandica]
MEVDDNKNLYEVDQYDGKDDFPQRPIANLQIHDTVPVGRKGLFFIIGIQVFVILILIILLGINGVTLTHLNTVDMCDSTGASTGATTGTGVGTSNDDQKEQLNNMTAILLGLQDSVSSQLLPLARDQSNMSSNIYRMTQSSDAKLDMIQGDADNRMMYLLNLTDSVYQILQTTSDTAYKLTDIVSSISTLQGTSISTSSITDDILVLVQELLGLQNASSIFNSIQPVSCKDIKAVLPNSPSGYYHVNSRTIYCNMDTLCNATEGWTRIGYLDMTDATQNCPSAFTLYQQSGYRVCRRPSNSASCFSTSFSSNGISYNQICGKVTAYQYRAPDAIHNTGANHNDINGPYVDGVSITRGSPRQHVWTLMAGLFENTGSQINWANWANCPCAINSPQSVQPFVGSNYYCESGNPTYSYEQTLLYSDTLWDGQGCGTNEAACCNANPNMPWFHRDYGTNFTTDFIELRICGDEGWLDEDVMVSQYEIYVK